MNSDTHKRMQISFLNVRSFGECRYSSLMSKQHSIQMCIARCCSDQCTRTILSSDVDECQPNSTRLMFSLKTKQYFRCSLRQIFFFKKQIFYAGQKNFGCDFEKKISAMRNLKQISMYALIYIEINLIFFDLINLINVYNTEIRICFTKIFFGEWCMYFRKAFVPY